MGLLDILRSRKVKHYADSGLNTEVERIGSIQIPQTLDHENAFLLANTVAEIFFPIDFMADRASKLRYYIADKKGVEVPVTELNRFINNINPLYTFSDLMYQAVFSYLADGNIYQYITVPSLYKKPSVNTISRLDVLEPNLVKLLEYNNISRLQASSLNDFIKEAKYCDGMSDLTLNIDHLRINTYDINRKDNSMILCRSPLYKSMRSINNLLATYSARYNVYVNNGAAGYITKKTGNAGMDSSLADRKDILKDLNEQYGITGRRNLWGITGVPIEFVNTLVDIQKLMPFEETMEDSIKIASTFQIPAILVPRKDNPTFDNQASAEKSVWENGLMSIVDSVASYFSRSLMLDSVGYSIKADYSTVSALNQNEQEAQTVIKAKLDNLKLLKEIAPEADIKKQIDIIIQSYE